MAAGDGCACFCLLLVQHAFSCHGTKSISKLTVTICGALDRRSCSHFGATWGAQHTVHSTHSTQHTAHAHTQRTQYTQHMCDTHNTSTTATQHHTHTNYMPTCCSTRTWHTWHQCRSHYNTAPASGLPSQAPPLPPSLLPPLKPGALHFWARRCRATYIQHNLEFHHLSRVGPKQLCALAHLGSTREAGTF